ncbi:hypothetical protein AB0D04_23110 [Streptomyces sp. NPDC048483]|uniref:hypothetical protein n=1 Tax=Streptomyces sp. NPDC048483 TaxID=3154927 RepID=UPI0034220718
MYVMFAVWNLTSSEQSVESLRDYLRRTAIDAFQGVEGMRWKVWFSHPERQIWGAVYLWDSLEAMQRRLGDPKKALEVIGYTPSISVFDVEAVAEGASAWESLAQVGLAWEGTQQGGPEPHFPVLPGQ